MKTPSLLVLLAALGFSHPTAGAAPAARTGPAKAYTVTFVERYNSPLVERGMYEREVRHALGDALRKLDRDHWIYQHFEALPGRSATDDCSILLLVFSEGKVIDIKLLNDLAERVLVARLKEKASPPYVVKR